jgi:hypothetical protein
MSTKEIPIMTKQELDEFCRLRDYLNKIEGKTISVIEAEFCRTSITRIKELRTQFYDWFHHHLPAEMVSMVKKIANSVFTRNKQQHFFSTCVHVADNEYQSGIYFEDPMKCDRLMIITRPCKSQQDDEMDFWRDVLKTRELLFHFL